MIRDLRTRIVRNPLTISIICWTSFSRPIPSRYRHCPRIFAGRHLFGSRLNAGSTGYWNSSPPATPGGSPQSRNPKRRPHAQGSPRTNGHDAPEHFRVLECLHTTQSARGGFRFDPRTIRTRLRLLERFVTVLPEPADLYGALATINYCSPRPRRAGTRRQACRGDGPTRHQSDSHAQWPRLFALIPKSLPLLQRTCDLRSAVAAPQNTRHATRNMTVDQSRRLPRRRHHAYFTNDSSPVNLYPGSA